MARSSFPLANENNAPTSKIARHTNRADRIPLNNADETDGLNPPSNSLVPANTSYATYLETLRLAMDIDTMKLPSIPMLDIVLRNPDDKP